MKDAEIRMLRLMWDVTMLHTIKNEYVRGTLGVLNTLSKTRDNKLKSFRYV